MTSVVHREAVEPEQAEKTEDSVVVRRDGVFWSLARVLFWPFSVVVRAYRGFWWVLGFRKPQDQVPTSPAVSSPARQSLAGRKRLRRVTRLILSILPRRAQAALGYPVSSSIGKSLSPEIRVSPTKPCGKGSKRKQDELDEDEEEEEHQTWVEALTEALSDEDVGQDEDPDYEPSTVEEQSEEYHSHNDTAESDDSHLQSDAESDLQVDCRGVIIIEDVNVAEPPSPSEAS